MTRYLMVTLASAVSFLAAVPSAQAGECLISGVPTVLVDSTPSEFYRQPRHKYVLRSSGTTMVSSGAALVQPVLLKAEKVSVKTIKTEPVVLRSSGTMIVSPVIYSWY